MRDEKADRGMAALDTMAEMWAAKFQAAGVDLRGAVRAMLACPDAEDRILRLIKQAHAEGLLDGFYAGKEFRPDGVPAVDPVQAFQREHLGEPYTHALNSIPATWEHDEGAYAQCGDCGRYTLNPRALRVATHRCECGSTTGWSGSFKKPDQDAKWSGKAPDGVPVPAVPKWERRQGMRARGGWTWGNWLPCTEAEAQRVTSLQSWQVRQTGECGACNGTGRMPYGVTEGQKR